MTETHFRPFARYAASAEAQIRWYDDETGQERLSLPVTLDRLADAGATLAAPDAGRAVSGVAIGPYQPPNPDWKATITYVRLEPRTDGDDINFLNTKTVAATEVFEDRDDAVAHLEAEVPQFADAPRKDARNR